MKPLLPKIQVIGSRLDGAAHFAAQIERKFHFGEGLLQIGRRNSADRRTAWIADYLAPVKEAAGAAS